jgi:hypothetical protein
VPPSSTYSLVEGRQLLIWDHGEELRLTPDAPVVRSTTTTTLPLAEAA